MRRSVFALFILLLAGCEEPPVAQKKSPQKTPVQLPPPTDTIPADTVAVISSAPVYSPLEQQLLDSGLVDVQALDSSIVVDLRYSTEDNFMHMDLYGDFTHAFLQPDVAEKLLKAQQALKARYPYYSLIIYDAVRPMHIQRMMWDTLPMPPMERQKYLSNPSRGGSLHNYGAAVDVSIIDSNGIPLDMGTAYDFFGEKAHPVKEAELLEAGELSERQVSNRKILRSVMYKGGFFGIQTEWWHFNSCTRDAAMEKYGVVE